MSWTLGYWLVVGIIGVSAAVRSLVIGLDWGGYLKKNRPELLGTFRLELVRDWLLLSGLSCNLATGIFALTHWNGLTIIAILTGASLFSGFAVLNLWLRLRY